MAKIKVELNRSPEAGHILQWGFRGRNNHNRIETNAAIKVPIFTSHKNKIILGMSSSSECTIKLKYAEEQNRINITKGKNKEYEFTVSEDITAGQTELFIEIETPLNKKPVVDQYGRVENITLQYVIIQSEDASVNDITLKGRIQTLNPVLDWSNYSIEHQKTLRSVDSFKYNEERFTTPDFSLFWGDLHVHSSYSRCGGKNGSLEENYEFGRDVEKLDFMSITDHDYLTDQDWQTYCCTANAYNKSGNFVTFIGKEWTSFDYGHKNIYYKGDHGPNINCWHAESNTPKKLYKKLKSIKEEAVLIPHHPSQTQHLLNWDYYDEELERLVEIFSGWGNSEYYDAPIQDKQKTVPGFSVQDALTRGHKLGFIGGSDAHVTMAGCAGMMGVYAKELSRQSIWEAIKARRVYATTGARMKVSFNINGFFMGSVISINQYTIDSLFPLSISIAVISEAPLAKVELLENNCVIHTHTKWELKDSRMAYNVTVENEGVNVANGRRHYYIRASQYDGHIAWSSPIWIDFTMQEKQENN